MQFDRLRRRDFIPLLGGAVAGWPLAARAQSVRTIGFLGANTPAIAGAWAAAFAERLRELGWIEDRTVKIDLRWAEGRSDRAAEIAAEFVRMKVNIIVTYNAGYVNIARQATSTIPIVFALAADPVGIGLVASLARPGGNVTGLSAQNVDLTGKRVELLREVVPGLRRLAILTNPNNPTSALEIDQVRGAAVTLGLQVSTFEILRAEDISPALAAIAMQAEALFVVGEPLTFSHRMRINTLALGARLPTTYSTREYVEAGGLMSYGPSFLALFRRAADYVDKILRGANPSDLPVEQPTKYLLVINLITAKALGIDVPPTLLARADEVIE